jgi:hypothetical protein
MGWLLLLWLTSSDGVGSGPKAISPHKPTILNDLFLRSMEWLGQERAELFYCGGLWGDP